MRPHKIPAKSDVAAVKPSTHQLSFAPVTTANFLRYVDAQGVVYLTDSNAGLYILQFDGG